MPSKYRPSPRLSLTAQVPIERFNEVSELAESLGIPRHRLLLAALEIGIPLAAAQLGSQATQAAAAAQQQQQG